MIKILSIIIKEFKLLLRDPGGLIMLFILPASFIFVLSIALQGTFSTPDKKEKMDILFVNQDEGELGSKIIEGLEQVGYFRMVSDIKGNKLTLENGKKELENGKYRILINIPPDTTEALNFKKDATVDILIDPALSNEFAAHITNAVQSFVYISIIKNIGAISNNIFSGIKTERLNTINKQLIEMRNKKKEVSENLDEFKNTDVDEDIKTVINDLNKYYIDEFNSKIKDLNRQKYELENRETLPEDNSVIDTIKKNIGLKVNQFYYTGTFQKEIFPNSVQQNVPGWTIFALFWIVQTLAINMIAERQSGAFKRILIAPIGTIQFIIGKTTPFFLINAIQALFMFSIGVFVLPLFGAPGLVIKNVGGLILITMSISLVAISMGLLLASISKTMFFAASFSAAIVIIMTLLGGIMVPKFVMPNFMQKMSFIVPHGWALDGYLNIFVRNFGILKILPNVLALLLFALFFFMLSLYFFNKIAKADN